MSLSIKNPEAERLAKDLARETGSTVTQVVIEALQAALLRVRGRRSAPSVRAALLEISSRCAALPDLDARHADEILGYDRDGAFR